VSPTRRVGISVGLVVSTGNSVGNNGLSCDGVALLTVREGGLLTPRLGSWEKLGSKDGMSDEATFDGGEDGKDDGLFSRLGAADSSSVGRNDGMGDGTEVGIVEKGEDGKADGIFGWLGATDSSSVGTNDAAGDGKSDGFVDGNEDGKIDGISRWLGIAEAFLLGRNVGIEDGKCKRLGDVGSSDLTVGRVLSAVVGEAEPGSIGIFDGAAESDREGADDGYVVGGISGVCGAAEEVDVPVTEVNPDILCNCTVWLNATVKSFSEGAFGLPSEPTEQ
jgi:hypothetical protein